MLQNAVISIEDRKFYEHHGVDSSGTTRALFKNVDAGGVAQGGSTITQQLVKNTFSVGRKRDLTTKAREAILAIELEKQLTKSQILEDYLNLVYFGNGAYGVQAAVERYFPGTTLATPRPGPGRAARRAHPVARGAEPDQASRRRGPPAQRSARRDGGQRKVSPAAAKAAEVGAAAHHGELPALAPARLLHGRGPNVLLNDDPNVAGDPAEVLGADPTGARRGRLPRRAEDLHVVRPDAAVHGDLGDEQPTVAAEPGRSPHRWSSSTTPTAACARSRTAARSRRCSSTRPPRARDARPVRRSRCSRSRPRCRTVTRRTTRSRPRRCTGGSTRARANDDVLPPRRRATTAAATRSRSRRAIARSDNCAFVRTELSLGPGNFGADGVKTVDRRPRSRWASTPRTSTPTVVSTTLGTKVCTRSRWRRPTRCSRTTASSSGRRSSPRSSTATARRSTRRRPSRLQVLDPNVARTETQDALRPVPQRNRELARSAASPGPRRARPAPPTQLRTPGSSVTPRSTPPRCGWATRTARSRCAMSAASGPVFGAALPGQDLAARSWRPRPPRCRWSISPNPTARVRPPALHHRARAQVRPTGRPSTSASRPRPCRRAGRVHDGPTPTTVTKDDQPRPADRQPTRHHPPPTRSTTPTPTDGRTLT